MSGDLQATGEWFRGRGQSLSFEGPFLCLCVCVCRQRFLCASPTPTAKRVKGPWRRLTHPPSGPLLPYLSKDTPSSSLIGLFTPTKGTCSLSKDPGYSLETLTFDGSAKPWRTQHFTCRADHYVPDVIYISKCKANMFNYFPSLLHQALCSWLNQTKKPGQHSVSWSESSRRTQSCSPKRPTTTLD